MKYLGLPIGANLRKLSTWDPVVEMVRKRLRGWDNLYMGGGLMILKFVLSAISIYYLSFFKAPIGIISKIEALFNYF